MNTPLVVSIVSTSPILASAIQMLLQREAQISTNDGAMDLVLLLPLNWEEFERVLETSDRAFAPCPWLILADLRLAGMFLGALAGQPATVIAPDCAPGDLWEALWLLAEGRLPHVSTQLLA